jgi:signal transduction histidine kinase
VLREAATQVTELERSRATSVRVTDDARRGLERNLHDGAQQRLLVVGMQLANASDGSANTGRRTAAGHVADALQELRRIGRGDAAIIAELGLADAVTSLAGSADVTVHARTGRCHEPGHDCWPDGQAITAYRLLVAAIVEATHGEASAVNATFACLGPDRGHTVAIEHDGTSAADRSASRDRVLAGAGRIDAGYPTGPTLQAWLP